jgi:GxxExxY protein
MYHVDRITGEIIDAAFGIHVELGPGLLESVYQVVLAAELERRGLRFERHKAVPFEFRGQRFQEGFRVDLLVEKLVIVELKSAAALAPVHTKQLLTYLRLMKLPVGLLINFGAATLKEGIRRVVNGYRSTAPRLRVRLEVASPGSRTPSQTGGSAPPSPQGET